MAYEVPLPIRWDGFLMRDFEWDVAVHEYMWFRICNDEPVSLDEIEIGWQNRTGLDQFYLAARNGAFRQYRPFAIPSLFRSLAEISTPRDVLTFANRYGTLGAEPRQPEEWMNDVLPSNPKDTVERQRVARQLLRQEDPLWLWRESVSEMHACLNLLEGCKSPENASPILMARLCQHFAAGRFAVCFSNGAKGNHATFEIRPTSLLEAIWLMFAQAVFQGKGTRTCPVCKRVIDLGGPSSRRTRQYCSVACRVRAHRARGARNF